MANEMKCGGSHSKHDGVSWWESDARGIPLARVCGECIAVKLARYRPEVLRNRDYQADENIEPNY
jgi:hypothetical protein